MFHELGRLPVKGDRVIAHGVTLTVVDVSDHTIRRLYDRPVARVNALELPHPHRSIGRGSIAWASAIRSKAANRNGPPAVRFSSWRLHSWCWRQASRGCCGRSCLSPTHARVFMNRVLLYGRARLGKIRNLTCSTFGDAACSRAVMRKSPIHFTVIRWDAHWALSHIAPKSPTARRNSRPVTPATPSKLAGDMSFIARPAWTSGVEFLAHIEAEVKYALGSGSRNLVLDRARRLAASVSDHVVFPEERVGFFHQGTERAIFTLIDRSSQAVCFVMRTVSHRL